MRQLFFYIDIVGACNLRCPSCPVGNSPGVKNPTGHMRPELLDRVLTKAVTECEVTGVGLYNWGEPLLHPQLDRMVRLVRDRGLDCLLSSNLNILSNVDALLAAGPSTIYVSLSGFTQDVYGRTHRDGDIEQVKLNMAELARAKERTGSQTGLGVFYHLYLDNLAEVEPMRSFAEGLGFDFTSFWARMLPLEKALAFAEGRGDVLTEEDRRLINQLALPLDQALKVARAHGDRACMLLEDQVTLDFRGDIQLCCAVFDAQRFGLGSYLETPLEEIQTERFASRMCASCTRQGGHVYYTSMSREFDALAEANIRLQRPAVADTKW